MPPASADAPPPSRATRQAVHLDLDEPTIELLKEKLPAVAERTVEAVTVEVAEYSNALAGPMGTNIQNAVQLALGGFLHLVARPHGADLGTPLAPALEGAYALGRGEARSGRSVDALLAAYRVGARVAWRELSTAAVEVGLGAGTLAKFAELVFAYIDELSAASVAGHSDELANTGRVRRRHLDRLGQALLTGAPVDRLTALAERADWPPPGTLTAVVVPSAHARSVVAALDPRTLRPEEDLPGLGESEQADLAVLLVPDAEGAGRASLLRALRGHHAHVGPPRPWTRAHRSYARALRSRQWDLPADDAGLVDTDQHLARFVLQADTEALADLRRQVLSPLASARSGSADRLAETLRAWLLHQGRREDVAAALHVHPQTVRYRMGQLRELYGERLHEPETVLALVVALGTDPAA
jgi:hypothetical protein